ncbi:unnamed protein product [Microthlaspi erraticum]|uniref:F-box domain-containing protein n=1 Tax=Microthlaspi erraticum TaxID=1685480 RepID=A0A6D2L2U2_9BRAS|nr:unnamed protein product [Microthlaspi erraticum]
MMMSDLPGDLLEEILCLVPAASLKQLRSSCKRWNSLYNSGRFTRKHLDRAAKQFLILMLKEYRVFSMSISLHGVPSVEATGQLNLIDPRSSSSSSSYDQFEVSKVSHCDGLLLCNNVDCTTIVVWNPCTGQTRWIQPYKTSDSYALGSYRYNNKSQDEHSYKILGYGRGYGYEKESAVYEINSNAWRILDVTRDFHLVYTDYGVSLKGNTYWFASDEKEEKQLGIFLVCFDYTRERFGRLGFPCHCPRYDAVSLSVVREQKLSVLLKRENTSRTEIWVTNKIGEAKVVSWSMFLAVNFQPDLINISHGISFLVDEEKKAIVCCDNYFGNDEFSCTNLVHIVGEDNKVTQVDFGPVYSSWPFLFNYVPSLTRVSDAKEK